MSNHKMKSLPTVKQFIFAFVPLLILLLAAELTLRCVYFQTHASNTFSLLSAIEYSRNFLLRLREEAVRKEAARQVEVLKRSLGIPKAIVYDTLFMADEGKGLLEEFKGKYEENFKKIITEIDKMKSKLLVLYIPSAIHEEKSRRRMKIRHFFSELAGKYGADFLDLTEDFLNYSIEVVTLLPEDNHLSRFGNKLVVKGISSYLDKHSNYRTSFKFARRPNIFGDLEPNQNRIWDIKPDLPYRVITNKQGLRMNYDVVFPKKKQRILFLGDSFTFGPFLSNKNTYPSLLGKKYPDKEIINAGIWGYTIDDEAGLFIEKAKYTEPDITVLQVLDNDIFEFISFIHNENTRNKENVHLPSKLEKEFLSKLKAKYKESNNST